MPRSARDRLRTVDRITVHCRSDVAAAQRPRAQLHGDGHVIVAADLTGTDGIGLLVDRVIADLGGIDVLVHNAGIFVRQPVVGTSWDEWLATWRVLDVNLLSGAALAHRVIDHLVHRAEGPAGGRIVMVGSRGAYRGEPEAAAYGARKAGLHSLAPSLAVAVAPHRIGVAAVAPGFIRTERTEDSHVHQLKGVPQ